MYIIYLYLSIANTAASCTVHDVGLGANTAAAVKDQCRGLLRTSVC